MLGGDLMLKIGDTIQCADDEDMVRVSTELAKEGIFTDWPYITEPGKKKNLLVVTGVEDGNT